MSHVIGVKELNAERFPGVLVPLPLLFSKIPGPLRLDSPWLAE
jgi:hypothetical protein